MFSTVTTEHKIPPKFFNFGGISFSKVAFFVFLKNLTTAQVIGSVKRVRKMDPQSASPKRI